MSMSLCRVVPALAMVAGLCCSVTAFAQPANDLCATVASGGFDIPGSGGTVSGTTLLATADGDCSCDSGSATAGRDVFYRFTPATTGQWRLSLCGGAVMDTVLSVHTGCPANISSQIACDDDSCGGIGVLSRVTTTLNAGTTYLIRVGMWSNTAAGGAFTLTTAPLTALTNDNCSDVAAAAPNIPGNGGVVVGTTETATSDGTCSCDDGEGGAIDVFYKFVPSVSATWTFSLCTGTTIDTAMSVHSGCPASASNELICNDDGCGGIGVPSELSIDLVAGQTYLLRVGMWDSTDAAGGPFTLTVSNNLTSGACCAAATGACTVSPTGIGGCASGTTFQGTGTTCTPNPCPQPPPPANDECGGAVALTLNVPVAGTLHQATGTDFSSCSGSDTDVWYSFTAPAAGSYGFTASLVNGAFVPAIAVYPGTPCPAGLDSNDAAPDGCQAQGGSGFVKRAGMNAGDTVLIRVADFAGDNTDFSVVATTVVSGACCDNTSGACVSSNTGASGCASGSTYQGNNTSCTPNPCPQEACCNTTSGSCSIAAAGACASGTTGQGVGSTCTPNPCPQEACCNPTTGICSIAAAGACASGTTGQGVGSACTPNPCPQPPPPANDECANAAPLTIGVVATGTNVSATESVVLTNDGANPFCTQATWATGGPGNQKDVYWSFTAPATTDYVIDTCGSSFDTIISIHSACPIDQSNLVSCNDDSTSGTGNTACSSNGLNSRIPAVSLTAGTTYYVRVFGYSNATGAINLLVNFVNPPAGVCCRGATCSTAVTSSAACTGSLVSGQTAGASFPPAANCNNTGVTTAPCCYADYNKTGGISVQDIFDFLSDWFAGSPYANTGGTGAAGPLSVQNIFDFLGAWFAGGC